MKSIKFITSILLLVSVLIVSSCKKDAGPIGQKEINGTITYKTGTTSNTAVNAFVHIAYGTKDATTTFDQTVVADKDGKYTIVGLAKGDYYITAEYTDTYGALYTSPGFGVTIGDPKTALTVDITLQ